MKRITVAMVALFVLAAGPASAQVITSDGVSGRYSRQEYSAASHNMEFLVEVRGVPFAGMTQEVFGQALVDVLSSARPPGPRPRFTLRPTEVGVARDYRLVMVFGPARGQAFQIMCEALDTARFEPVPAGEVRVAAAFCRKDELLSHGVAIASAKDVSDPGFRQMLRALLPRLFPTRTSNEDGGN